MNACALLNTGASVDRAANVARVALSQNTPPVDCPVYLDTLTRALEEEPPPFCTDNYSDIYREASANGQWLAISLITNSEREGDGAKRLWSLAACADDKEVQQLIKRHAVDESNHAKAYLALLDLAFPGAVEPKFRSELNQLSPSFTIGQELFIVEGSPYARKPSIDDFVQMNIAEIRTTIHHMMQRPALAAHCPEPNRVRMTKILDTLLRDELRHVAYTAVLIEAIAKGPDGADFPALFTRRVRDFNRITTEEFGKAIFD